MRPSFALLCWSVLLAASLPARLACAHSSLESFSLNWTREPGAKACISSEALRRLLQESTGVELLEPAETNLKLEGVVRHESDPPRWFAHVRIASREGEVLGERYLDSAGLLCSSLTPSLILVLAMVVAPELAGRALPPTVLAEIAEQARAEELDFSASTEPARPQPAQQPQSPGSSSVQVSKRDMSLVDPDLKRRGPVFSAGLSIGTEFVPSSTAGLTLGFGVPLLKTWSIQLNASYWEKSMVPVTGPRTLGGGVVFQSGLANLGLCRRFAKIQQYHAAACFGAALSFRATSAEALTHRSDRARPYAGPTASVELGFELAQSWFLLSQLGVATLLPRHRFVYADVDGGNHVLFHPGLISGWLALGLAKEL